MVPPRPEPASRAWSRNSLQHEDGTEDSTQAGRTSANLAGHASAQSLREASRPSSQNTSRANSREPNRSTSTPNLLRKKSRPNPEARSSAAVAQPIPEHSPQPDGGGAWPAAAQTPPPALAVGETGPDPIATSFSSQDFAGRSSDEASSSSGSASKAQAGATTGAALASQPSTSSSYHPRPSTSRSYLSRPEMSQQNSSSLSLTRQTTPRSVRDLGSDYTRYYNPFVSRNNSSTDLAGTPLPRYNSSSHLMSGATPGASSLDLEKRLSDPFGDPKRYSNPFDQSRQTTAPTTRSGSPDPEKAGAVATTTMAGAGASSAGKGTPMWINDADPEKVGFFPWMDDRLGAPTYDFPLFSDQREDDDDLHMPQWDDDIRLRPRFKDHFTRDNFASTIGMILMTIGLLCVFVVLPVVSYTTRGFLDYTFETPLDQMPKDNRYVPESWAQVNNKTYSHLQNVRTGLIDPDTPGSAKTKKGIKGDDYKLVFSDEFNEKNRTFYEGDDPYFYGFDGWYGATMDLEWYDPDALNTGNGTLQIHLDKVQDVEHNHNMEYRSGMMHSWNHLCFKGGIFEVSVSLPGPAGIHGWWPGVWTMGNLGRPGYLATTDGMWPYTYNDCDAGITPNQSMTDGVSYLPGQRLPSCSCEGEEHPTPGKGRGCPEIDIIEVSADWGGMNAGVATQSFQVAPFDIWWYPNYEFMQTPSYEFSMVNTYTGGPFQQAVSTTSMLSNDWYDGKQFQKYWFEYVPGEGEDAYIAWVIGDIEMMRFDARAIGPNGNVGQRIIAEEPMSLIMNLGFSENWVAVDWENLYWPTDMYIDYVRWYQKEGEEMVTCDPPGYETTEYIRDHPAAYNNANYTHWEDAGYSWPKNTLMNGCSAGTENGNGNS
ncbi:hypothetical protein D0862_08269 [Hortaea werneckii]|uniref:GH16 domain-containing protein n=1 Tax=Hortaea werneckii TaxID=91943 RepID=A0A3M7G8S9_HORWE|nr:hypothetical protein D0862_08269 [Hortaea werneckii]